MKKLFRLLFVAAMFISGCNGGGNNAPEGYTESKTWPNDVIAKFLGEDAVTVPDAKADSLFYREYQASGSNPASIDIMIKGDYEASYVAILKNSNWVVSTTRSEAYGYESYDSNKKAEVDVMYDSKVQYTYIDIYRYKDVHKEDPFSTYSVSTIWPQTQINEFLDTPTDIPSYQTSMYFYKAFNDLDPKYFEIVIQGDIRFDYSAALLRDGWNFEEDSDNILYNDAKTAYIKLTTSDNYTYIGIYNYGTTPSDYTYGPWPQSLIQSFLGKTISVPAPTTDNVYYKENEETRDDYANIEILVEGDLEASYSNTLNGAGWEIDNSQYDDYGIMAFDPNNITEIDFFTYEGVTAVYVYRYSDIYGETSEYGTVEKPLTVSQAVALADKECTSNNDYTKEPVYAYGEVSVCSSTASAYTNVTLTDGSKLIVCVSIDIFSGYEIEVGDYIEICGYIVNKSGNKVFDTVGSTSVTIIDYEKGGSGDYEQGSWPTAKIATFLGSQGFVLPMATNDDVFYKENEADEEYVAYFEIVANGDLESSYLTTLEDAGWEIDTTLYALYGYCAVDPNQVCEVDFVAYDGYTYFYVYRYDDLYGEDSKYGTLDNPLTVTEALTLCAEECPNDRDYTAEPVYCYGIVTSFTDNTTDYKNVYISDGDNEVLIYKLNLLEDYTMQVGDTIEVYGYMKNYQGTLEFSTNGSTGVSIVDYNQGGGGDYDVGPWPTTELATFLGSQSFVVPAATKDDVEYAYYEAEGVYVAYYEIIASGDLETSYTGVLENANWEIDTTQYDDYGICAIDSTETCEVDFFVYEGYTYFYVYRYDDLYGEGGGSYGTLDNPLTVTEALAVGAEECVNNYDCTAEPIYCYGEVQLFTDKGTYYKEVTISDGENEVLIYSLSVLSGYSMHAGDIIEIYGYMKNFSGELQFATNGSTYVTIVDYDDGSELKKGPWPSEKIASFLGVAENIVPAATTEDVEYYDVEAGVGYAASIAILVDGGSEDAYKATLEGAGWTIDDSYYDLYGYFADDANCICELQFFEYEGELVVYIYRYSDIYGSGEIVTEWPSDTIATFLGAGASTVPSFEADEYGVEEVPEEDVNAAYILITAEEDASNDYLQTFKNLGWAYNTLPGNGYEVYDQEHTVFIHFLYNEESGFYVMIYRYGDLFDDPEECKYGTISNSLVTTGDCLNTSAFGIKNGSGYATFTGKVNGHDYEINANQLSDYLQIRAKSDSGLINTKNNGVISSVSIDWNKKSVRDNNTYAEIEIYASESAFTIADMYDGKDGLVLVCVLTCQTSCTLTFNADTNFSYIGIKGSGGAAYINNIYINYR